MPHILFHRPTIWDSEIQCSTKLLARLFAQRGFDVTYLQSPLDPIHLAKGTGGYWRTWRKGAYEYHGVRIVTPATPVPVRDMFGLNGKMAASLRYRLAVPPLNKLVKGGGQGAPDLIWTTVPGSMPALRRAFPHARHVFHVIDYYPAFRGEGVKPLERADYAAADTVITIGQTLKNYVVDELGVPSDKVEVLGQGVELERYRSTSVESVSEPDALTNLPRPRAIWSGVLSKGDPELFHAAATAMAERGGSLILLGPSAPWADALAKAMPQTVHALGSVRPDALPAYLAHADIGLMLYDRSKQAVYKGQNPLKLYEYAAAGLQILSTSHEEFAFLDPPIFPVKDAASVHSAIDAALDPGRRLTALDNFAEQHDWARHVTHLVDQFFPDFTGEERRQ